MDFRLAHKNDLPQLKTVYAKIVDDMNKNGISIWNEMYPYKCFSSDIEKDRLFVLAQGAEIISAFALCPANAGAQSIKWRGEHARALYLDRFGVNVRYARTGIGRFMLAKAIETAAKKGAGYLRLFVVDSNLPAISLYEKFGFEKAEGAYDEIIDDTVVLHEFGFQIKTSV